VRQKGAVMRLEVGWGSLGSLYVLCCFQLSDTKVQLGLARLLRVLLFGGYTSNDFFRPLSPAATVAHFAFNVTMSLCLCPGYLTVNFQDSGKFTLLIGFESAAGAVDTFFLPAPPFSPEPHFTELN